ncbi:adhesion domain-containing protein [Hafnia paralvei]|uniref:adhesion domain-containing protein n=1 Tax=Hafnia paralvei TaxID=546367 RepID=UPI00241DD002|nr:DUF823 domain-containing adhesin [Hafnia paralvei]
MLRYQKNKRIFVFLSLLAVFWGMSIFSVQAALKSGTWQITPDATGEINGTSPQADSAAIPVYQGSVQLDPTQSHSVPFSAKPGDFSVDAAANRLILNNPHDIEGDMFSTPPDLQWENQQEPGVELVWADAATPDVPLDPQPLNNKTFCFQHLAGRHLVVWPTVDQSTPLPQLFLSSLTGTPTTGTVGLKDQRVTIDIAPSQNAPLTVSANHYDETLKAAKVQADESIVLTITTHDCAGNVLSNVPFVITRSNALGRQGAVNNSEPVHIGNTELTTADTEYHGVTDVNGTATVTVTQDGGPGVKTTLRVKPSESSALEEDVDVIFTTLTSPDSSKAQMWGHMAESTTVLGYTFSRPVLAQEMSDGDVTVTDHNEIWAQFDWSSADSHCSAKLPDIRRLSALVAAQGAQSIQDTLGWPLEGDDYWSSSTGETGQHQAVDMRHKSAQPLADSERYIVSCLDKAVPTVIPKITLTPDDFDTTLNASKTEVGDTILMKVAVTDSTTGESLPYYYYNLNIGTAHSRSNETDAVWDTTPVVVSGQYIRAQDTHNYQGVTDANGEATVTLSQPQGAGVRTTITAEMRAGYDTTDTKDVIFTVLTSPNTDKARMWGHMKNGIVEEGNLFTRPLLVDEGGQYTSGSFQENNESWAIFDSLDNAESMCAHGQVPSVASLKHLYGTYSGNKIATEWGWPTNTYSYLAANTDGTQYHRVDLKNGSESSFTGKSANALVCSETGLVAQIQVTTNGDASQRLAKAKVGETVTLMVQTINAINGSPAPEVAFTVTSKASTNRREQETGFDSGGPLIINGQAFGNNSAATGTFQGGTDAQGKAQLVIEQPTGPGVKTPLTISLDDSRVASAVNYDVIFTVPTSPDNDKAHMWGHMTETVTVGDDTFSRPRLADEFPSQPGVTNTESNETWGRLTHPNASASTAAGGCAVGHLPNTNQLLKLYNAYSDNKVHTELGWPVSYNYWSSVLSAGSTDSWDAINLTSGKVLPNASNQNDYFTCLKNANPTAMRLTLEAVNSAQWFNELNAAKVKMDDTLQLKITAKDSAGNPVANTPLVISRGDDYSRQNVKESSLQPMVINGTSLASTTSLLYASTGADGSLTLNVTRSNRRGTKTTITAKLFDNASVTANMDTIFTMYTSPDSDKAVYWGHMPETLTAANGSVFKRPLLFDELQNTSGFSSGTVSYEKWARFTYTQAQNSSASGCGNSYIPEKNALDSLYGAYPNGGISSVQGWPTGVNYWSGTADSSSGSSRYYQTVNLANDASTNEATTQARLLTCLNEAKPAAHQLELSSTQYIETLDAAKAQKGSDIALLIKTKDAQGNLIPNVPFYVTRNTSVNRAGTANTTMNSYITVANTGGQEQSLSTTTMKFFGVTDDSGQAMLNIRQDNTSGLKTAVKVTLDNDTSVTKSMAMIFTVVTSPDSDKAQYWGHMPETLTATNGAVFKRPELSDEIPQTTGVSYSLINGEKWAAFQYALAQNSSAGGCGAGYVPDKDALDSLYSAWPNGAITSTQGWPSSLSYLSNTVDDTSVTSRYYKVVNLGNDVSSRVSLTQYSLLTCQSQVNSIASQLVLSSAQYVDTLNAAKAPKGDKITLLVTTQNAQGEPVPNTAFTLTRGTVTNRAGTKNSTSAATTTISYAGKQSTSSQVYLTTDNHGQAHLDISQDNSTGLQTPITVTLDSNATVTQTMPIIFSVITSPDSDKAQYWGHMPETFTASNGTVFSRPLLFDEYPTSATSSNSYTEGNEKWPTVVYGQLGSGACSRDQMPLLSDLQTLYNDHPDGKITTDLGLPVKKDVWAANQNATSVSASALNYQYVSLSQGTVRKTTSTSAEYAQLCLAKSREAKFTVSFPADKWSTEKQATVVAFSEPVSATVAATDASGKPIPGILVRISTGESFDRQGNSAGHISKTVTETLPIQGTVNVSPGGFYNGITGDDGKAVFDISQPYYASKSTLTFSLDTVNDVKTQDFIATTIRSPDSPYATNWGSMAETIEVNGVTYKRPVLAAEFGTSPAGKTASSMSITGELWATFTLPSSSKVDVSDACGSSNKNDHPQIAEIKAMYDRKLVASGAAAGWPYTADGSTSGRYLAWNSDTAGYQLVDMSFGAVTTASASDSVLVTCPAK